MPRNPKSSVTILQKAAGKPKNGKQTTSIRVTIPAFIVDKLGLKVGDWLEWDYSGDTMTAKKYHEKHIGE